MLSLNNKFKIKWNRDDEPEFYNVEVNEVTDTQIQLFFEEDSEFIWYDLNKLKLEIDSGDVEILEHEAAIS